MLLRVENLSVNVATALGPRLLLRDVSLAVAERQMVGLVGGSGSGKTTLGLAILGLLSDPLYQAGGEIYLQDRNISEMTQPQLRNIRGKKIAMVFQEPLSALNPVLPIGYQIGEVLQSHTTMNRRQVADRTLELLSQAGVPEPSRVARSYPHQLSGGLRQRAMIAQAIALSPQLIIADEPTSNLDVTVQARILELFKKLKTELGISFLFITHDLPLVRHMADEVAVMSSGQIVEQGTAVQVCQTPRHEYTRSLMQWAK